MFKAFSSHVNGLQRTLRGAFVLLTVVLAACGGGNGEDGSTSGPRSRINATASAVRRTTVLTINKVGQGTVTATGLNCGTTCSVALVRGSTILLHAEPAPGYTFSGWDGAGVDCPSIGDCEVIMSTSVTAQATFSALPSTTTQYELALTISGTGSVSSNPTGIDCPTSCNAFFDVNTPVTLTATPGAGYTFSGWSGSGLSCGSASTCIVPMSAARSVTASFSALPPGSALLTVNMTAGGTVEALDGSLICDTSPCLQDYTIGRRIILAALPLDGYIFTGWSSSACSSNGSGTCEVAITEAQSVAANFAPLPASTYALTVTASGAGRVTSSPAGIDCGSVCSVALPGSSTITLTAVPASGYAFGGWTGACSGTAACTVTVNNATMVGASFYKITYTLAVTKQGTGLVLSDNGTILCGVNCSYTYDPGASVTLKAMPGSRSTFSGWTGACSGTGACVVTMSAAASVQATFTSTVDTATTTAPAASTTGAPVVLYTDTPTGPTSGGENNLGGYLSIFGKNFGTASGLGSTTKVYIGGTEVANYRYLGNAKVGAKLGMQQITVQVGALGGAANGTALPIKVVVGGASSNTTQTFTPAAGRILFVSLSGNDSTAVAGDISKPWRNLQAVYDAAGNTLSTFTGAYFALRAGDHIVIRGGNWSDVNGLNRTWMQACPGSYAKNGTASAWIHITAYPGPVNGNAIEDVHYSTPANAGLPGGIAGPENAATGLSGEYWSISNLRMDVSGGSARDAAPINFQFTAGPWRVVNNELGPWVAGSSAILNAAAISGHGNGNRIIGNHVHDIEGIYTGDQALQNHGIYSDSMSMNWEVAYNWIHDIKGGSLIQFNDNQGCAGEAVATSMCGAVPHTGAVWPGFTGMRVHHNWLENSAKYGINYNDQGSTQKGTFEGQHWNNVIIGTALPPIRINATQPNQQLWFAFNTLHNCMTTSSGSGNGYVRSEGFGAGTTAAATIRNTFYNNIFSFGAKTVAGTGWFADSGGISATTSTYDFKRNLYFANGQSPGAASTIGDSLAVTASPSFTNATTSDLSLVSTSAARNQGTQALLSGFSVGDDFTGLTARSTGGAPDIGAFEATQ